MLRTLGLLALHPADLGFRDEAVAESWLERRLAGQPLLRWLVARASDAQQLDRLAIVAPPGRWHDLACALAPSHVTVLASAAADPLAACVEALGVLPAEGVVRLRWDTPLLDPALIDRLAAVAAAHPECDYVGYHTRAGGSLLLGQLGLHAEWCRAAALRRANTWARAPEERRPFTRYVLSHPELFQLRFTPAPAALDRDDLRLALRREEDWEHARVLIDALGPEELDWQRVARLLEDQPALRARMAQLNRAEAAPA